MLPRGVGGAGAQKSVQKSELENTNWVMHEYRLERPGFQEMVLCRVRNLRKEHNQKKKVWSTPWWELQEEVLLLEGGGRGGNCRDYRKRKAARCGEKDAAAAHERKLLRRRGHYLGEGASKCKITSGAAVAAAAAPPPPPPPEDPSKTTAASSSLFSDMDSLLNFEDVVCELRREDLHQDQQPRYSQLLEAELLQFAEFSTCAVPASGGSLLVDHPSSCNGTGSSFFSDMDNSLLNFEDVMICDWKEGGAEEAEESMSFAIPDLWD